MARILRFMPVIKDPTVVATKCVVRPMRILRFVAAGHELNREMSVCGDLRDRYVREFCGPFRCVASKRVQSIYRVQADEVARLASLSGGKFTHQLSAGGCRVPHHLACRTRGGTQTKIPATVDPESCIRALDRLAIYFEKAFPMTTVLRTFWNDEGGVIISAELVIILTIGVLGMIVGLSNLQHALTAEFADLSLAFQSLNQSYSTPSYRGCWKMWGWGRPTSWVAGSCFYDYFDGCVGYSAYGYGGNGCDIYSASNYDYSNATCPTGACTNGGDVALPSPSATTDPSLTPVPDAKSGQSPTTP